MPFEHAVSLSGASLNQDGRRGKSGRVLPHDLPLQLWLPRTGLSRFAPAAVGVLCASSAATTAGVNWDGRVLGSQSCMGSIVGVDASRFTPAVVSIYPCSHVQKEEMVFMAVINFKALPLPLPRPLLLLPTLYNCHMMAML